MTRILIVGEVVDEEVQTTTHELLAAGRKLADSPGDVVAAALLGPDLDSLADNVFTHGADRVYLVQDPVLAGGSTDAQVAALETLCRQWEPTVVLVGKTDVGRDLGPRLGYRLGAAVAQDCTDVWLEANARVGATRPVYGGNAVAKIVFGPGDPQVVTVRPNAFEPLEPDPSRSGEIENLSPGLDDSVIQVRTIETVMEVSEGVRLEDASIVVSGGRGLGGPEPFRQLEELAMVLGGAMGASRAACDAGWLDYSHQVGLTGKSIAPELYIAIGISGASQHMTGCSRAKNLVAINTDAQANAFKEATLGVVGDWSKVLPAFMDEVKKLKAFESGGNQS